jgi:hypothetical protein
MEYYREDIVLLNYLRAIPEDTPMCSIDNGSITCNACRVHKMNYLIARKHLRGKRHKEGLKEFSEEKNANVFLDTLSGPTLMLSVKLHGVLSCSICDHMKILRGDAKEHLLGKLHQSKSVYFEDSYIRRHLDSLPEETWMCNIKNGQVDCSLCKKQNIYPFVDTQLHLRTKSHVNRLKKACVPRDQRRNNNILSDRTTATNTTSSTSTSTVNTVTTVNNTTTTASISPGNQSNIDAEIDKIIMMMENLSLNGEYDENKCYENVLVILKA